MRLVQRSSSFLSILLFLLALPLLAAADDCSDCVSRKKQMCARECRLVPTDKSTLCQQECVEQYCLHRCEPSHPAIARGFQSCEDCLDQQFNLCEANCPEGTDRIRAMCQLGCAKLRCGLSCGGVERNQTGATPKSEEKAEDAKSK